MRISLLSVLLGCLALSPEAAMAWSQTYVLVDMAPAFHYGGPKGGTQTAPGPDCANGMNEVDLNDLLAQGKRSKAEIDEIQDPSYSFVRRNFHLSFRGPNKESVYDNPTLLPDPGLILSTSKVAEGLDLDGDPRTGFNGVDGEPGVDNALYKVVGCTQQFRGPIGTKDISVVRNDRMRAGIFTLVMVVSGTGDPADDPDVTVGFYASRDPIVRDAQGAVAPHYSFTISAEPRFQSTVKARIKDGVLESVGSGKLTLYDPITSTYGGVDLVLEGAKLRLKTDETGALAGLIGGYREVGQQFAAIFPTNYTFGAGAWEKIGHMNALGVFNALLREADGMADAQGRKHGISSAYRFRFMPSYVMTPGGEEVAQVAKNFSR